MRINHLNLPMVKISEGCCGSCDYFDRDGHDEDLESDFGHCFRYPPSVIVIDGAKESVQPEVYDFNQCGEFKLGDKPDRLIRCKEKAQS